MNFGTGGEIIRRGAWKNKQRARVAEDAERLGARGAAVEAGRAVEVRAGAAVPVSRDA